MKIHPSYDVIIIGAGTAGLTARREVAKRTENYAVVHDGPLGTTCARVGCMPSKALIEIANALEHTRKISQAGFLHGDLKQDSRAILAHVRSLRDRFVKGVLSGMEDWQDKIIYGRARFIDTHTIEVKGERYSAKKFILATGSSVVYPEEWQAYQKFVLTSDELFEQENLPPKILIVGLGVIGLELGQALSRLGLEVTAVTRGNSLGGLTDPLIQDYVLRGIKEEMTVHIGEARPVGPADRELLSVEINGKIFAFNKVLLAVGRRPNLKELNLERTGVVLNERGLPSYNENNLSIEGHSQLLIAGDANAHRPLLHEAADDGKIAGYNSVNEPRCFKRRIFLGITFSDPQIAVVGEGHRKLLERGEDFVTGTVSFEDQGRALTKLKNRGLLHVYVKKDSGHLLGAEFQCPDGEHIAHLLAWAISMRMTVTEALRMPFYHPVIEEGLRTALRSAAKQLPDLDDELFFCDDPPIR